MGAELWDERIVKRDQLIAKDVGIHYDSAKSLKALYALGYNKDKVGGTDYHFKSANPQVEIEVLQYYSGETARLAGAVYEPRFTTDNEHKLIRLTQSILPCWNGCCNTQQTPSGQPNRFSTC